MIEFLAKGNYVPSKWRGWDLNLESTDLRSLGIAAVERSAMDQQAAGGPQVQFPAGRLQKVILPLISE